MVLDALPAMLAAFRGRGTSADRSMVYWVFPDGPVLRRRLRVRRRRQQRVPGGLHSHREPGGVPHRGDRRGQELGVDFFGDRLFLPAGLLLRHQRQHCVLQCARGRRRLLLTAALRRTRHHRCAAAERGRTPPMRARVCTPERGCACSVLVLRVV
jgi:hypothetical protein